jgi:hypothetical protein
MKKREYIIFILLIFCLIYYNSSDKDNDDDNYNDLECRLVIMKPIYTDKYIAENRNKIIFEISEMLELANIIIAYSEYNKLHSGTIYDTLYKIFNEYMTRGVFLLYIYDNYSQNLYNEVSLLVIDFMINSRHFLKFRELYNKLLELYKLISQEESIKKAVS